MEVSNKAGDLGARNRDAMIGGRTRCRELAFNRIQTTHLLVIGITAFGERNAIGDSGSVELQRIGIQRDDDFRLVELVMGAMGRSKRLFAS